MRTILASWCVLVWISVACAAEDSAAQRGYRFLTEVPVLSTDFDQEAIDAIWQGWPEPARSVAEKADPAQRRRLIFQRYGLTLRPDDTSGKPLQYVVDEDGNWTMNCFSCHGGSVYGLSTPGAPNNRYALQTLTEEIARSKARQGKLPSRMEIGSLLVPLGTTNGTTNAVVFGMGLMKNRDADLNVVAAPPQFFTHHDMDAPPWWYFYKRPDLYIDGFVPKGHRLLMQFMMIPENGPSFFQQHEDDFRDVMAYLESLRPPPYKGQVDAKLASRGELVFQDHCAECHGTYGADWSYPNRRITIDEIGTDPVRLTALTASARSRHQDGWFTRRADGSQFDVVVEPEGYVAPPLDGIWASAPYFHNGSVPTLWHVLHPDERPTVWRPKSQEFDSEKVGLSFESVDRVPSDITDPIVRRSYFDTRRFGKSNAGHDYPNQLSEGEKAAVLEYLKTL